MRNGSTKPVAVESVDRALQLLLLLRERGGLSVSSAADLLGVAPSTAYRLLSTLVARDFATQDGERRYHAGPELVPRVVHRFSYDRLRAVGRPVLQSLYDEVGETVQLMVIVGSNIQFIDGIESTSALRVAARIGDQMPAYCSAGGKAMLAAMDWSEIKHRHPAGLAAWPTARLSSMEALRKVLAQTRSAHFGMNDNETEQGVTGVGVPVLDESGRPVAAFTVAIPSARFQRRRLQQYVKALTSAADQARALLGSGGVPAAPIDS